MLHVHTLAGGHAAVLLPGEELTRGAADLVAVAASTMPADAWFGDHELLDDHGAVAARSYVPEWSPEHLRHTDIVNGAVVLRPELVPLLDDLTASSARVRRHELLLRLLEHGAAVRRIPDVLSRRPASAEVPMGAADVAQVVNDHLRRSTIDAIAEPLPWPGAVHVRHRVGATPRVSVIVPTRGGTGRVWGRTRTFVIHAVQSLLERSTYPDLEVVVAADTSTPEWVVQNVRRIGGDRVVVVPYDLPFNFSDKINRGVAAATGELLLLLNDDTELAEPASIEAMVAHLQAPAGPEGAVGAVGARLLFDDGTMQHAGHLYNEQPLHSFRAWPADVPGPGYRLQVARECSGVTAAALLVHRDTFHEMGGFPTEFPLDYNDIHFCLSIRRSGRRIIWTPDAVWYHFEGRTRARGPHRAETDLLLARWGHELTHDPYHHPLLEVRRDDWRERVGMPPNADEYPGQPAAFSG
jgi:glycosyltransferase involved in cell wall biosynthesis